MKQINFSRVFPATHPKKGQPTYFVEGILKQLGIDYFHTNTYWEWLYLNNLKVDAGFLEAFQKSLIQKEKVFAKSHTLRFHAKPIKVDEEFQPTCWAGNPYRKTKEGYWKIKFAPPIKVVKTWDVLVSNDVYVKPHANLFAIFFKEDRKLISSAPVDKKELAKFANNDGLTSDDLKDFFKSKKEQQGYIICWNKNLKY